MQSIYAVAAAALIILLMLTTVLHSFEQIRSGKLWEMVNKQEQINRDFQTDGFAYDNKSNCFYLLQNAKLRRLGHSAWIDHKVQLVNRIIHSEPIQFEYAGRLWMIEIWKGQYGILTGAEVGIYHAPLELKDENQFSACHFTACGRTEMLPVSFTLKKKRSRLPVYKTILKRKGVHWRLSGFLPGMYSLPGSLFMDVKLRFPNREMRDAFISGLEKLGYMKGEYSQYSNTVKLHYYLPYAEQPLEGKYIHKALLLKKNEDNCRLYQAEAAAYKNPLDQLLYLRKEKPDIYHLLHESLYIKEAYE